jgi:hypothetical protein
MVKKLGYALIMLNIPGRQCTTVGVGFNVEYRLVGDKGKISLLLHIFLYFCLPFSHSKSVS